MAVKSSNTLKSYFETGDKPSQLQFWDWLDSYWHRDDQLPMASIAGLVAALNQNAGVGQIVSGTAFTEGIPFTVPAGGCLEKIWFKFENSSGFSIGFGPGSSEVYDGNSLEFEDVFICRLDYINTSPTPQTLYITVQGAVWQAAVYTLRNPF